jgi:hypothetical protein
MNSPQKTSYFIESAVKHIPKLLRINKESLTLSSKSMGHFIKTDTRISKIIHVSSLVKSFNVKKKKSSFCRPCHPIYRTDVLRTGFLGVHVSVYICIQTFDLTHEIEVLLYQLFRCRQEISKIKLPHHNMRSFLEVY